MDNDTHKPFEVYGRDGEVAQPAPPTFPEVEWQEGRYLIQRVSGDDPGLGMRVTPLGVAPILRNLAYWMLEARSIDEVFAKCDEDVIVHRDGPWTLIRIYDSWNE